ncbi:TPA: AraC family transcriptional regulator [Enterobacter hormaechei subsp. steigerwaltii]|nr:AraC family transcriptional regulator [Enterobacter hormaechei subsp. steigerwaltii]
MDPFSDILQLLSARSYTTTGQRAGPTWAMHYPGFDGMKFIFMRKGILWFRLETESTWHRLEAGDGVIITRHASFFMATSPDIKPVPLNDVPYVRVNGLADYGGDDSIIQSGKMEVDQFSAELLFGMLPVVVPVKTGTGTSDILNWLMTQLHNEHLSERPGSSIASNHLMHLIMIEGLRGWLSSEQTVTQGWLGALRDPRIMRSLAALHDRPEKNWKLIELAEISGLSRAGFSRKFSELTATSPLQYLTQWRMRLASKSLRLSNEPVKHIAFRLGYASESTFSTVFRRVYGMSPSHHRKEWRTNSPHKLQPYIPSGYR